MSSFNVHVDHPVVDIVRMTKEVWQMWFEIGVALNVSISRLEEIHKSQHAQDDQARFHVSHFDCVYNITCIYMYMYVFLKSVLYYTVSTHYVGMKTESGRGLPPPKKISKENQAKKFSKI